LDTGRRWQTQFWKGTTQGSFRQSLVEIGQVVSNKKIFKWFFAFLCLICIISQTITKNRNFFKWPKLLYFKPECAQIWTVYIMMNFLTYIMGFFYELWTFADFDWLCKLGIKKQKII
jgi:hypothetical protein